MKLHVGLDIGSTTVKLVILDEAFSIVYETYKRHFSNVKLTINQVIEEAYFKFKDADITIAVTGSGALSVHKALDIAYVQEVIAATEAIERVIPETDVVIELGGEDSKITYMRGAIEQRMNSICAGGTGAFIDQMASLLQTDALGLNELSKDFTKLYPIASRCGVFAKTDIQALINQGAKKADIAVSVFQSVVNQTISNLACGRPIRGKVAFLGGPLHFLPMLKARFVETLNLRDDEVIAPDNGQIFVALGAAIYGSSLETIKFKEVYDKTLIQGDNEEKESETLAPLFESEEEKEAFILNHQTKELKERRLEDYQGAMYLGIDSGSTTSKVVLISEDAELLYTYYGSNEGRPLDIVLEKIKEIYYRKQPKAFIKAAGCTGYGEDFLKEAFDLDFGEVETIAHFKAAEFFNPKVDFILDIGGQDMKSMKISDGIIESVLLNEACSSGCGSFLETFAKTVNMDAREFSQIALEAKAPVDLGSRCTVFMNSNVKRAQKEGASLADISAGLAYSLVKNAIQKVIKVRDPSKLGQNIVVQGGTFLSDAVLRAFELVTGVQATRPSVAGLMGAFGMALISKEKAKEEVSSILPLEELEDFHYKTIQTHCHQCTNNCALNVNIFPNGKRYITGNRCEKGAGITKSKTKLPNLYAYKLNRVFDYESLPSDQAKRGQVGLPRVLNMYENYPFWHTFFTSLGYEVVLSDQSSREIYEKGIESIPSETACYPAKITHGHIENLIAKGVKFIFYPSVFYEEKQYEKADNTLNCPVVAGYSEVIKNNLENLREHDVQFMNPFISFDDRKKLVKRLSEVFPSIPVTELQYAVGAAYEEADRYRSDLRSEGERTLKEIEEKGIKGIVLAGRPYHIDPEINHGIPELITSLGLAVISEDSIAHLEDMQSKLRVLDQWTYHSRLYRAAQIVGQRDNLEMIQLNSFGCGIDAVTTDQVNDILHGYGKIYTALKIDEVNNLGAIKIRIRSLLEVVDKRENCGHVDLVDETPIEFTKEMRKNHTILIPQMSPIHFDILEPIVQTLGYKFEVLQQVDSKVVNEGLKYVNNDLCYPSIFVVGQFIDAIKSGRYDTDNLTLVISQTGGACRASNYVGFIRKALKEAGYGHIPVIALSFQGIESHEGFNLGMKQLIPLLYKLIIGMLYGDLIMRLSQATRPYEVTPGETNKVKAYWMDKVKHSKDFSMNHFKENINAIVKAFEAIEISDIKKPRVGIVGEILVKYLPSANNYLADKLEAEGAEVVIPDLMDFIMYSFKNAEIKYQELSKGYKAKFMCNLGIHYIERYRKVVRKALANSRYHLPKKIEDIMAYAKTYVSLGNQYGEGWLLTGEMVELIEEDCQNIVCVQPFGCLPNHITGKGVIKAIRETYPKANIVPIDCDASASEVNQFNRIKLMLAQAKKNIGEKY